MMENQLLTLRHVCFPIVQNFNTDQIRKSKDYVYGIWVYKALDIWKGYYRVKKITGFVHETVNRAKK